MMAVVAKVQVAGYDECYKQQSYTETSKISRRVKLNYFSAYNVIILLLKISQVDNVKSRYNNVDNNYD